MSQDEHHEQQPECCRRHDEQVDRRDAASRSLDTRPLIARSIRSHRDYYETPHATESVAAFRTLAPSGSMAEVGRGRQIRCPRNRSARPVE
jgi:hypothetical protein